MTNTSCLPISTFFATIKNLFTKKAVQKVASSEPKLKEIANHNFRNILHLRDIYSNESINELDNIYNFVYNTV